MPHVTGEWFQKLAGIRLNHIPYGGASHWQTDLLAGNVDATFYPLIGVVDHVRSASCAPWRLPAQADRQCCPTCPPLPKPATRNTALAPGRAWWRQLAQASARAVQRPEFREFVSKFGAAAVGSSPQDFARYLRNERSQLRR